MVQPLPRGQKVGGKTWLQVLLSQPLYKITVNWDLFHANTITSCEAANATGDDAIKHLQYD